MAPRRQIRQPAVADGEPRQGRSRQVRAVKRENEVAVGDKSANPPKKSRGRPKNAVAGTIVKNEDTKGKSRDQAEKEPADVVVVSSASEDEIIGKKIRGRKNTEKAGKKATKANAPVTRKPKTTTVENDDGDPGEGSTKRSTRRAKKTVDESDVTAQPISAKAASSKKRKNTKVPVNEENEREKARERRSRSQGRIWLPMDLPKEERRMIMMMHAPITKKKKVKRGKTIKLWLPKDLQERRKIAMTYMNSL